MGADKLEWRAAGSCTVMQLDPTQEKGRQVGEFIFSSFLALGKACPPALLTVVKWLCMWFTLNSFLSSIHVRHGLCNPLLAALPKCV